MPVRLSAPPAPEITPAKVVLTGGAEPVCWSVRVLPPRTTDVPLEPARLSMVAPAVVAEMSKLPAPARVRLPLLAMAPAPLRARVPPLMAVAPV